MTVLDEGFEYDGQIYGTEIIRGLDVFALVPSEYMSENEIAAASMADYNGVFNPQQQLPVSWPAHPVVAMAYVDQLERSDSLPTSTVADLTAALDSAAAKLEEGGRDTKLASRLDSLASDLKKGDTDNESRRNALAENLQGIAANLR